MAEGFNLTPEQFAACLAGENTVLQIIYNAELVDIRRWQAILPNMGYNNITGEGGTLKEAVNNLAASWVNYRRKRARSTGSLTRPIGCRRVQTSTTRIQARRRPIPSAQAARARGSTRPTTTRSRSGDWWTIGGRWTGYLQDYDPSKDPDAKETCFLCHGGGMRNDALGIAARAEHPEYTCNGCQGTGQMQKFHLPEQPGDIILLDTLLAPGPLGKRTPFSVLEPDGTWNERGDMGWFGIVHGEKKKDTWVEQVEALLNKHKGSNLVAVVCDLHI